MGEVTTWVYDKSDCDCGGCTGTDTLRLPLSYALNADGTYTVTCNGSFNCEGNEGYSLASCSCTASGIAGTISSQSGLVVSWNVGTLSADTTFTVVYNISHFGTKSGNNTITVPKSPVLEQLTKTTSHTLTATASNYTSLQWKESTDGTSWTDAANGTETELIIATGTGTGLGEAAAVQASYTAIASYDKYVKCVATNAVGNTESNVKHVTFTSGDAAPTATDV